MSTTPQQPVLRVVTFPKPIIQPPEPCSGGYTCICTPCSLERAEVVKQGIRPNPSDPLRKAA